MAKKINHKPAAPAAAGNRLIPPKNGVTIRMYRIGHGDCFLLAFPSENPEEPVYVLIDCGYKPGSPGFVNTTAKEVVQNIREATNHSIAVAVITHEHQDHVNAITESNFGDKDSGLKIKETWVAWTENPEDKLANRLREKYKDKLLGLIEARKQLAAAGDDKVKTVDAFLEFELGGEVGEFGVASLAAAAKDPANSANKRAMDLWKKRATHGPKFLRPDDEIRLVPGTDDIRVYALGPPRDEKLLEDLDPHEGEGFHKPLALRSPGDFLLASLAIGDALGKEKTDSPFRKPYTLKLAEAHLDPQYGQFFHTHYRHKDGGQTYQSTGDGTDSDTALNPPWRRIDNDWLYSAEQLALAMNNDTNNASLVLAFELGKGGKVLLFAADAQRGNWASWSKCQWQDGDKTITARDLLARTALYKVGHHGSHNATLDGKSDSAHANLAWFGQNGTEFYAMIPAVREWANTKDWDHPLKDIKDAVTAKAKGRVLQTDTDVAKMEKPDGVSNDEWKKFLGQVDGQALYFDLTITK